MTDTREVGEIIGQGSSSGAVVSAANLDNGVMKMFNDSCDEISYGSTKLKPLMFQDDIARIYAATNGAQVGNAKLSKMMKLKYTP